MKTNVVVTGGAGYLGSILCEHLLDAGYRLIAIDKLLYGRTACSIFVPTRTLNSF